MNGKNVQAFWRVVGSRAYGSLPNEPLMLLELKRTSGPQDITYELLTSRDTQVLIGINEDWTGEYGPVGALIVGDELPYQDDWFSPTRK